MTLKVCVPRGTEVEIVEDPYMPESMVVIMDDRNGFSINRKTLAYGHMTMDQMKELHEYVMTQTLKGMGLT